MSVMETVFLCPQRRSDRRKIVCWRLFDNCDSDRPESEKLGDMGLVYRSFCPTCCRLGAAQASHEGLFNITLIRSVADQIVRALRGRLTSSW